MSWQPFIWQHCMFISVYKSPTGYKRSCSARLQMSNWHFITAIATACYWYCMLLLSYFYFHHTAIAIDRRFRVYFMVKCMLCSLVENCRREARLQRGNEQLLYLTLYVWENVFSWDRPECVKFWASVLTEKRRFIKWMQWFGLLYRLYVCVLSFDILLRMCQGRDQVFRPWTWVEIKKYCHIASIDPAANFFVNILFVKCHFCSLSSWIIFWSKRASLMTQTFLHVLPKLWYNIINMIMQITRLYPCYYNWALFLWWVLTAISLKGLMHCLFVLVVCFCEM